MGHGVCGPRRQLAPPQRSGRIQGPRRWPRGCHRPRRAGGRRGESLTGWDPGTQRAGSRPLRSRAWVWGAALWEGREAGPRAERHARAQAGTSWHSGGVLRRTPSPSGALRRTGEGDPGARGRVAGPRALPCVGDPSWGTPRGAEQGEAPGVQSPGVTGICKFSCPPGA